MTQDTVIQLDKPASLLQETRTFFLTGEITNESYQHVAHCLLELNQEEGDITMVLNSGGGEVSQGFAIYELIKNSANPVTVYGMGQVMSIASAIIQAGEKRYMSPLCRFMIHNGTITFPGPIEVGKFRSQLKDMHLDSEIYYDILCERSKLPRSKVKQMCDAERYMNAQQCLQMGFIDDIECW